MTYTAETRAKIVFGKLQPVPTSMNAIVQSARDKERLRIVKLVRPAEEIVVTPDRLFPSNCVTTNEASRVLRVTAPLFPGLHFTDGSLTSFENNYLKLLVVTELRPVVVLGSKHVRAVEAVFRFKEGIDEVMESSPHALDEVLVSITVANLHLLTQRRVDDMDITFPCSMESLGISRPEIRQTKVVNLPGTYITIRGERSANFGAGGG